MLFSFLLGAGMVGAAWYFWPKIKAKLEIE